MGRTLVFQTDFGVADGAVCAMYGVAMSVSDRLRICDLTHDIPPYNVWEASYRLWQTVDYWPEGTVFVSVVDPGVGCSRRSVVARTHGGHYVITPDNGTLTHLHLVHSLESVRTFDETENKLPHARQSYTFYGRDVYAYVGARLAAKMIDFESFGTAVPVASVADLTTEQARCEAGQLIGMIDVLDVRFGNLWTNIDFHLLGKLGIRYGARLKVIIRNNHRCVYENTMTFVRSFAAVAIGEPLIYVNSLEYIGIAINQGAFAQAYSIGTGANWQIALEKCESERSSKI
ncbi:MAG: S-adenosyl-l-methionine hydroxide adenosyltransferase family protein [Sporolactobacillus sp.]